MNVHNESLTTISADPTQQPTACLGSDQPHDPPSDSCVREKFYLAIGLLLDWAGLEVAQHLLLENEVLSMAKDILLCPEMAIQDGVFLEMVHDRKWFRLSLNMPDTFLSLEFADHSGPCGQFYCQINDETPLSAGMATFALYHLQAIFAKPAEIGTRIVLDCEIDFA
ncbi:MULTISPECIES: hypothetical protein [Geothrix]|uniref:hypothetical protein n=1 Tax=Geothrix TaxID=44675 RepID=UPI001FAD4F8A|nr:MULTISPECIES: hypothetical protein [Geothrix]